MQLITTRNKEISFAELKKAISSGNGLELIRPGDKFAIELKNGELVNAVCVADEKPEDEALVYDIIE